MQLLDEVRSTCRSIAETARQVAIDLDAWREPPPADTGASAPEHPDHVLQLDAINFGSGWFPTLRKPRGLSGFRTVEAGLRAHGPWPASRPGRRPREPPSAISPSCSGSPTGYAPMSC